uniref:Uncharacterized protein n=1 Tax=Nelumbo nucifera TaxID=4432 RepID=A0A822ZL49_NELNU|nr:TPA_asm: hypothetical protein HUJ06_003703 [Nelumbo nucifera]
MSTPDLSSNSQFPSTRLLPLAKNGCSVSGSFSSIGFGGFEGSANNLFLNRSKVLRPLETFPPVGAQPTLFQKRAAFQQNSAAAAGNSVLMGSESCRVSASVEENKGKGELEEEQEKKRKNNEDDEVEEGSVDGSGFNYDSDEAMENNKVDEIVKNGGNGSITNSTVTSVSL